MANAKIYSDLAFAPVLNNEGDFSQVYDQAAINQSLFNILNTNKGSRLMDPDFGCNFNMYLFDMFDSETANKITDDIFRNFIQYEPRVVIDSIDKDFNYDFLQYTITVNYHFVNTETFGKFQAVLQKL